MRLCLLGIPEGTAIKSKTIHELNEKNKTTQSKTTLQSPRKRYQWSNELTGLWVMYFPQSPVTWFIPQSDSVKEESCLLSCPLTSKPTVVHVTHMGGKGKRGKDVHFKSS